MSISTLYLITRLDNLIYFCVAGLAFSGFGFVISMIVVGCTEGVNYHTEIFIKAIKYAKIFLVSALIYLMGLIFIPSTKEIAFIYLVNKATTGEIGAEVEKFGLNSIKTLNVLAEEYIKNKTK